MSNLCENLIIMRKTYLFRFNCFAFLFFFIVIALQSCKKDTIQLPTDNLTRLKRTVQQEQLLRSNPFQFAEDVLSKVARHIAPLTENPAFPNFVESKASEKFDGQYEVLITQLLDDPNWGPLLGTDSLSDALSDLYNIDSNNYYPQVYIPSLQHLEDEPADSRDTSELFFAIYAGENPEDLNENEEYPAYQYVEGELVYIGHIDEEFGNTHRLWVVSINESVNNYGYLILAGEDPNDNAGSGSIYSNNLAIEGEHYPNLNHAAVDMAIKRLKVNDRKERWLGGNSEINFKAVLHTYNDRRMGDPNLDIVHYYADARDGNRGIRIADVKKKKIGENIYLNVRVQSNWRNEYPFQNPVWLDYVVFEYDPFPAGVQLANFNSRSVGNPDWEIDYRSNWKDYTWLGVEYYKGNFCNSLILTPSAERYYATGEVISNVIEFETGSY